jgi:hypothetical protein
MNSAAPDLYPDSDYLKDFARWHREVNNPSSPAVRDGETTAKIVFSLRYRNRIDQFRYRLNRFVGIMNSVQGALPQLVSDRIARPNTGKGEQIPETLLLALLAWYRTLTDEQVKEFPDPDWPWVLSEFDRLESLP